MRGVRRAARAPDRAVTQVERGGLFVTPNGAYLSLTARYLGGRGTPPYTDRARRVIFRTHRAMPRRTTHPGAVPLLPCRLGRGSSSARRGPRGLRPRRFAGSSRTT